MKEEREKDNREEIEGRTINQCVSEENNNEEPREKKTEKQP